MNILSLDTSTPVLSLALRTEKSYEERKIIGNFSHSENLLPEIQTMMDRAGIKLSEINLLICTKGPGSFTGLRVGMATLKGISLASGAPLVSVPTLSVIEKSASPLWSGAVLSVIDAKKKKFYFRLSRCGEILVPDRDGQVEDAVEKIKDLGEKVLVTGPDAALFVKKVLEIDPALPIVLDPEAPRTLSWAMETLGKERLEEVGADDIGEGPVYIRRSDAEEMLMEKRKQALEKERQ